ncbi:hypothetical protein B0H13DRAFT_2319809 [Mycena leptocephala]|nr:hypothetical protein B0H13DRAFT_2319809 [Mycena leptocephala]
MFIIRAAAVVTGFEGTFFANQYIPRAEHDALCVRVDALKVWTQQVFATRPLPPGVGQQPTFKDLGQGQGFNLLYNNTAKAQNLTPGQGLRPMQMPPLAGGQGHRQGRLSFSGHGSGSSAGESSGRITPVQMQHQHQPTPPPPQAQTPRAHSQTQTQTQPATPGCSAR